MIQMEALLQAGTLRLKEAGIEDAALDAWYLLSDLTGISRASYYSHPEQTVSREMVEKYQEQIAKREARVPLQHLTGSQEFMGLSFQVNERVLIPRQDTECLVEKALEKVTEIAGREPKEGIRLLDLCTGSGCILLSMLYHGRQRGHLHIHGTGSDLSREALQVARKNGEMLGLTATWVWSDVWEHISGTYELIVSNPPYIPTREIQLLEEEVRDHDPRMALDGREDGLFFYREITAGAGAHLTKGGWLLVEIGYDQADAVCEMFRGEGFTDIQVEKDLAGLDRIVLGQY